MEAAEPERCPQCKRTPDGPSCRLVQDACGHKKCRPCLLSDEIRCKLCQGAMPPKKKAWLNHTAQPTANTCPSKICNKPAFDEEEEDDDDDGLETPKQNYNSLVIPSHVVAQPDGYKCTICDKSFATRQHVKYHLYCNGTKKPLQCDVCKKEFIVKSHLDTHKMTHQNRRPYDCDKCDKKFAERSKLNRHKFVHSKIKAFACAECGKAFKNKENLRTHRLIHKPEKSYACDECDAKFSHSSNLKKHKLTHNSDKTHMCDQCGKRFKLKWAMTVHRRGHLKIRPNECEVCEKSFIHVKDLQRHELIHLDAKGFTCGICGTSFKRRDNLSRHSKNTHPGKKPIVIKNKIAAEEPPADNPNAINVIKSAPTVIVKEVMVPTKQASVISYVNVPLKLAFKTPAFKNNYNIHRDYVEPKEIEPESQPVNIYEKILLPTSPTPKTSSETDEDKEKEEPLPVCQRIFAPFTTPLHYETSFDNKKHAIIKNIKFKLPAKYTKLKGVEKDVITTRQEDGEIKTYSELKTVPINTTPSVIVNSSPSGSDSYYDLHWRRKTAQFLTMRNS